MRRLGQRRSLAPAPHGGGGGEKARGESFVMNKKAARLNGSEHDIKRWEMKKWRSSIWFMKPEGDRSHPAPFPEELPRRLIKFFSFIGQTVLDPFLGSGTTMKVANELDRNCIGIELDEGYLEMIKGKVGFNGRDFLISYHTEIGNPSADISNILDMYEGYDWEREVERFFKNEWKRELDLFFGDRAVN